MRYNEAHEALIQMMIQIQLHLRRTAELNHPVRLKSPIRDLSKKNEWKCGAGESKTMVPLKQSLLQESWNAGTAGKRARKSMCSQFLLLLTLSDNTVKPH